MSFNITCIIGLGSPLYSDSPEMRERGVIAIKAGTLDDVADLDPAVHYWTRSAQSWINLPDNLPCFEAG